MYNENKTFNSTTNYQIRKIGKKKNHVNGKENVLSDIPILPLMYDFGGEALLYAK